MLDKHDTVGIDCVAMCVNDIICCGAKPLIFLDYIALGKNIPEKVADIVKGVADGCDLKPDVLWLAAKPQKCQVFTQLTNMTLLDSALV